MKKANDLVIDYNNPVALRKAGLDALAKELGPLGMGRCLFVNTKAAMVIIQKNVKNF